MPLRPLLTFLIFISSLFSADLKTHYTIDTLEFNASHIDPHVESDFVLYHFENNQHHKAFSTSKIFSLFHNQGLRLKSQNSGVIHVQRSSAINLEPIIKQIKSYYQSYYPDITIDKVILKSNGYIKKLPKTYSLNFKPKAYLYHRSTLQLSSGKAAQRYFFSYTLHARIKLFKARHNINRGKILAQLDIIPKEETFKRLKALPLKGLNRGQFRLKKRLAKGKILYTQDIEELPYVLKDKTVNVRLVSGKVHLEFQAVSLEDGHIGQYVSIKKTDGKKLKAKVISRNLVEIE